MKPLTSCILKYWLSVICLFFITGVATAQLQPNFRADTTQGCQPMVINFTNLTVGNATSWLWNLGNGIISTQRNPTTFYFDPGQYTVSLRVVNGTDTQTIVKENYITVQSLPEIRFQLSDSVGCLPFNIGFKNLSLPQSGTIKELQWDFGDGTFSNDGSTNHIYNLTGEFSISLKITNSAGCTQLVSKPNLVRVLEPVKAGFNFGAGLYCDPPAAIQFNSTSTGNIARYQWSFGNWQTDTSQNPLHLFNERGVYSVGLRVANSDGCADTLTRINAIQVGLVSASFKSIESVCQNTAIKFDNTTTPVPSSVLWNFGDGTTSNELHPSKAFSRAGVFNVTLTSFYGGCSSVSTKTITVLGLPDPAFTTSPQLSTCSAPLLVNFKSTDATAASYIWSFGDGASETAPVTSHLYSTMGLFNVSLQVTGNNGCINKLTRNNLVYYGPPTVLRINGLPYKGCTPFSTRLSAPVSSPETVVSYLWNFGDNTTSTEISPQHVWAKAGSYTVSLTIKTVNGCTTTFTLPAAIVLTEKPVAAFSVSTQNACVFQNIVFNDSTSANTTSLLWHFGDGSMSTEKNPEYNYKDTGTYSVWLIAGNNGCFDTLQMPAFIRVNPPIARFNSVMNCATPSMRQFKDSSTAATAWLWKFGDSTTSTEQNPLHVFPGSGIYNVEMTAFNEGCSHTIISPVTIIDEKPVFTATNQSKCKSAATVFLVDSVDTKLINQYKWIFGDGNSASTSGNLATYNYVGSGSFKPSVEVLDNNGCIQSVTAALAINIIGPKANFSLPNHACGQTTVTLTNLSEAQPQFPIKSFIWNYGDGETDTLVNKLTQHRYNQPGNYTVTLTVIDTFGCRDEIIKPAIINITKPTAAFSISDTVKCLQSNISFRSTSTGDSPQYLWNVGDGTTYNLPQFNHRYKTEKSYTIKLAVTDRFGCSDSLTKIDALHAGNVKASLMVKDTVSSCPPFITTFWNKSSNYASFYWDFDDGSFSKLDSPSHYYNTPGVYNIKLITNGFGQCTDTATTTITLKGPSGRFRYDPFTICSPGVATFVASTFNKASFIWDFGDGTITRTTDSITTHAYINTGLYKPKLLLVDVAGCQVPIIGKDTIIISKVTAQIKNTNPLFCDSATLQFFDTTAAILDEVTSYKWSFGDGTVDLNKNPIHTFNKPGKYQVTLQVNTKNGCTSSDTLANLVTIIKSPKITIESDTGICIDRQIVFKGAELTRDTSILRWNWKFGDGTTTEGQYPAARNYASAGVYTVAATATNSSGCAVTSQVPVQVFPLPVVEAGRDTVLCIGKTLQLQPGGASTYQWMADNSLNCTACASPIIKPAIATSYKVEGTSVHGCTNWDTISVLVAYPFKIKTSLTDTLCVGESAQLYASGSDIYQWSPATALSNANISDPVASPRTTTDYRIIVSDKYQCFTDTGGVRVVVYPMPVFSVAQQNYTLAVGNSVQFKTSSSADITKYKWKPGLGLSCSNCAEPIASPRNTTSYQVQASNDGGCKAEDNVTVTVICNNANIFIPNTFTPNGDGMNDIFYVRGKGIAAIRAITIYNRWGVVVFQKTNFNINDPSAGWNGYYNSSPANADVFIYKVDIVCENNQVFSLNGSLSLMR